MNARWIGAALVIVSCGGFGFSLAASKRREEHVLQQLIRVLNYLEWELQYHLTPLPELCRQAGKEASGTVRKIFLQLAEELDAQAFPDVAGCMESALFFVMDIPYYIRELLYHLGRVLGRFDLPEQVKGLDSIRNACELELNRLRKNQSERLRSYQTLGLCAGAALAILFI